LVTDSQIEDFKRDGALRLKAAFSVDWIERLRVGVDENFADPSEDACQYTPEGEPGGFYDDYCNWMRIRSYEDFIRNSPAAEIAGRLLECNEIRIYHEHVLVKEPGTEEVSPWHQDLPYYGIEGEQLCSIWLPLDPVPQIACPEFVAGSHLSGKRYVPLKFADHKSYGDTVAGYENIPDIDAQRSDYRILSWDIELGDCIVFHMATVHGAPGTASVSTRRRGFSTRWLGDDARYAQRPWETSPPFRGLHLEEGDTMDHPLFPVIWRR
jgi:ectoine hydroxylase-related dioxygenase (phytanoyl-CoA dioxygenase family)